jgi:hypothetical protein
MDKRQRPFLSIFWRQRLQPPLASTPEVFLMHLTYAGDFTLLGTGNGFAGLVPLVRRHRGAAQSARNSAYSAADDSTDGAAHHGPCHRPSCGTGYSAAAHCRAFSRCARGLRRPVAKVGAGYGRVVVMVLVASRGGRQVVISVDSFNG